MGKRHVHFEAGNGFGHRGNPLELLDRLRAGYAKNLDLAGLESR
jgi:hypothetical protein